MQQCACNSLYALCWSHEKKVYQWNTYDLDHILTGGYCLYKSLGTLDLLLTDKLPRPAVMLKTEIAHLRTGDTFLQRIVLNSHEKGMFLLFMGGFTTTLRK